MPSGVSAVQPSATTHARVTQAILRPTLFTLDSLPTQLCHIRHDTHLWTFHGIRTAGCVTFLFNPHWRLSLDPGALRLRAPGASRPPHPMARPSEARRGDSGRMLSLRRSVGVNVTPLCRSSAGRRKRGSTARPSGPISARQMFHPQFRSAGSPRRSPGRRRRGVRGRGARRPGGAIGGWGCGVREFESGDRAIIEDVLSHVGRVITEAVCREGEWTSDRGGRRPRTGSV